VEECSDAGSYVAKNIRHLNHRSLLLQQNRQHISLQAAMGAKGLERDSQSHVRLSKQKPADWQGTVGAPSKVSAMHIALFVGPSSFVPHSTYYAKLNS